MNYLHFQSVEPLAQTVGPLYQEFLVTEPYKLKWKLQMYDLSQYKVQKFGFLKKFSAFLIPVFHFKGLDKKLKI